MSDQETVPPLAQLKGHRAVQPDTVAPDGSQIRLLVGVGTALPAARASLCEVTLPAGQVSRPVWHRTVEEIWYVLEGQGTVWRCPPPGAASAAAGSSDSAGDADSAGTANSANNPDSAGGADSADVWGASVAVGPGDALPIPTGWRFQFRAGAAGPLRFLCYTSPPWPGEDEAQPAERGGLGPPTV